MNFPIRILFVNGGLMDLGGISTFLMNNFVHFDPKILKVDFCVIGHGIGERDNEIKKLNSKIYEIPAKSENYFLHKKRLDAILRNGNYQIIHSHADSGNAFILSRALKFKIPIRISHSHNTGYTIKNKLKIFINDIQKKRIKDYATDMWSCSEDAALWLYGTCQNVIIIKNAIDTQKFSFNKFDRCSIRNKYQIKESILIGNVGRLDYQKNQGFLIRFFAKCLEYETNLKLIIIGEGKLRKELEKLVQYYELENKVIFTGQIKDVNEYYSAFDIFVLPSTFEGFGISGLEAQCSGLPCIFSDFVPKSVAINHNISFLPLTESIWVDKILEISKESNERKSGSKSIIDGGYDIRTQAVELQYRYVELAKKIYNINE